MTKTVDDEGVAGQSDSGAGDAMDRLHDLIRSIRAGKALPGVGAELAHRERTKQNRANTD